MLFGFSGKEGERGKARTDMAYSLLLAGTRPILMYRAAVVASGWLLLAGSAGCRKLPLLPDLVLLAGTRSKPALGLADLVCDSRCWRTSFPDLVRGPSL